MRKQHIIGMSFVVASLVGVFVGAVSLLPANAQVCEYPLFIQQGAVDANVVFLFDSSGSMNEAIAHDAYDPNVNYSGSLTNSREYEVSADGWYSRRSFRSSAPTTPTAYLVNSDGGMNGIYTGNYLNWVFQHATATQRAEIPRFTRIQMAKTAVNDIVANMTKSVRYGVFKFNGDDGASEVAALGSSSATIISNVNNIVGDGWTPLGEALADIADYFRYDDNSIQYDCQRNFAVVVTDGYPTQDVNTRAPYFDTSEGLGSCSSIGAPNPNSDNCSEYLDDVAKWMRNNDMRTDMDGTQYVNTYTVGMNIDAPILDWTAVDGDGSYFVANNAAQLSESLQNVLRDILNRISSGAAVAVVSTEGQADDYLYRGKFLPTKWTGYLEAFSLPYTTGELPVWEAGDLLSQRSPSTRTIYTQVSGQMQEFTTANVNNLYPAMGLTSTVATNVINWTRGENVAGYRVRDDNWILGDIVDSAPVTVGRVMGTYTFNDFRAFRNANQDRERAIYVGGNDGMIHAFLAETGEELWAFIPSSKLPYLDDVAATNYCHMFSVNGTARVVDAYLNGKWRTVLIEGLKQGGTTYFALDVTDPRNPEFLWETELNDISAAWAQVEVARVKFLDKWVGFVGSGPNDATGEAHMIAFDMEDGTEIHSELLSSLPGEMNMATACKAVDLDFDGWHDVMYMGDLTGNLWRFGLNGSDFDRTLLFKTESNQPIQAQPIVTVDYNGHVFVYFGTGRYLLNEDFGLTDKQTFYCLVDDHGGTTISRSELVDQTNNISPVEGFRGWLIDLAVAPGERITEPDALVAGIIYFTSYAPSDEVCTVGGKSYLYAVKFRNGAGFDDDEDDSNDTTDGRITDLGDGIATKPVIDLINQKVLVQGSDTRIHVEDTRGEVRLLTVRSWRQQY